MPEEGATTGISVAFDSWSSSGEDLVGVSVRVDGELLRQVSVPTLNGEANDPASLQTGLLGDTNDPLASLSWQPMRVVLDEAGLVDVYWKGRIVVNALPTNYQPFAGRFIVASRTGGASQANHFDDLFIAVKTRDPVTP